VTPHTSKDVVKFGAYMNEWQKSRNCHLTNCSPIPSQWWNLSGIFGGATRSLELSLAVLPNNSTLTDQRRWYKCPYKSYHELQWQYQQLTNQNEYNQPRTQLLLDKALLISNTTMSKKNDDNKLIVLSFWRGTSKGAFQVFSNKNYFKKNYFQLYY